jgi:hypothetical protein
MASLKTWLKKAAVRCTRRHRARGAAPPRRRATGAAGGKCETTTPNDERSGAL